MVLIASLIIYQVYLSPPVGTLGPELNLRRWEWYACKQRYTGMLGELTMAPIGSVIVFSFLSLFFQSGMIRTQEADYFLKPLPSHLAGQLNDSAGGGPPSHILYKRSTEPQAPRGRQAMMVQRQRELENHHLFYHENQNLQGGFDLGHPQKQHFCGRRKKCM